MENQVQPASCVLHGSQLAALTKAMSKLAEGQGAILTAQARTEATISGLQREMEGGFKGVHKRQDATNGRIADNEKVTNGNRADISAIKTCVSQLGNTTEDLEKRTMKLENDMAAQEAFTPSMFKELAALRHDSDETAKDLEHNKGFMSGAAKVGMILWAALLATVAAGAWLWEKFISPK